MVISSFDPQKLSMGLVEGRVSPFTYGDTETLEGSVTTLRQANNDAARPELSSLCARHLSYYTLWPFYMMFGTLYN